MFARLALIATAVTATAVAAVFVVGDARARVPAGVVVAGVDVGGLRASEAERVVSARAGDLAARPVVILGPDRQLRTSGTLLGARPRIAAALHAAGLKRFGRARVWVAGREPSEIPLVWELGRASVAEVAERLGPALAPADAAVVVSAAGVTVRPGRTGHVVDVAALASRLESLPAIVRAPTMTVAPLVATAEARATARRVERLTSAPRTIRLGSTATTLQPATLRALVRVQRNGSGLSIGFDVAGLAQLLPASTPARDAMIRVHGTRVEIVPDVHGQVLDAAATAGRLRDSERRSIDAAVALMAPSVTSAELASLGIRDLVSEFTTSYSPGQPRVRNIQRASAVIDGTILGPGETFSMNDALGERTISKGYVAAPQIAGNAFVDSVGGGISQVATMLYNGAFFAGLELIEHQPHSLYIDRYPLGREATISWGGPELIFRNDWPAGVLIALEAGASSITVRFFSSRLGRRVETQTGVPHGHGGGSFVVDYTRRVYRGAELVRDERYRVRYGVASLRGR